MNWKTIRNWFTLQVFAFILIFLGVFLLAFILIAYGLAGYLFKWNIDPNASAQFGDFVGGVVGAIWALAGVILFYSALRLQSKDIRNSRKEFVMNRLTTVVYKQLEKLNKSINNLKIEAPGNIYGGDAALDQIYENILVEGLGPILPKDQYEPEEWNHKKEKIEKSMRFINDNEENIYNFLTQVHYNTKAIRSALEVDEDLYKDIESLKALFFNNIGWKRNATLSKIMYTVKGYHENMRELDPKLLNNTKSLLYISYFEDYHELKK